MISIRLLGNNNEQYEIKYKLNKYLVLQVFFYFFVIIFFFSSLCKNITLQKQLHKPRKQYEELSSRLLNERKTKKN